MIHVRCELQPLFSHEHTVGDFGRIDCKIVRRFANRFTGVFDRGEGQFYIKYHGPIGLLRIGEDLAHARRPNVGARPEIQAVAKLDALGVPTMRLAAWGVEGRLLWRQRSFMVTDSITQAVDLESLTKHWAEHPPSPRFRRRLVRTVAEIARRLHQAGLNHRDFYLCHFLLDTSNGLEAAKTQPSPTLYLIDLHRVQQRRRVPRRYLLKDLGGLLFSALDAGLTRRDQLRFIKDYTRLPLHQALPGKGNLWPSVLQRARSMYRDRWHTHPPPTPANLGPLNAWPRPERADHSTLEKS